MSDTQTKPSAELKSWEDVNTSLQTIGKLEAQIAKKEKSLNDKIEKLRVEFDEKVAGSREAVELLRSGVEAFARNIVDDQGDLEGAKTKKLQSGEVAVRKSSRWDTTEVGVKEIDALLAQYPEAVRIKREVNKTQLAKLHPDDGKLARILKSFKIKRVETVRIVVEPYFSRTNGES